MVKNNTQQPEIKIVNPWMPPCIHLDGTLVTLDFADLKEYVEKHTKAECEKARADERRSLMSLIIMARTYVMDLLDWTKREIPHRAGSISGMESFLVDINNELESDGSQLDHAK